MDPLIKLAILKFQNTPDKLTQQHCNDSNIDINQSNEKIQKLMEEKIKVLEEKVKNPNLSESEQAMLRQQMCLIYINSGDYNKYNQVYQTIGLKSISDDALFALHSATIRYAIAQNDEQLYSKSLQIIQDLKNPSFDSKSQLQIYQSFYKLLFCQTNQIQTTGSITILLTNNISTFTAEQLISFEDFLILVFIVAICKLQRKELSQLIEKQMDNFSQVTANTVCNNLLSVVNDCCYENYVTAINQLNEFLEKSFYLNKYKFTLCNLFKAKVYDQYIKTYNSVQLEKITDQLKITRSELISELEYFIFNKQVKAKMTEDLLIRVNEDVCSELFDKFYDSANKLITKVELAQKK